MTRPRHSTGIPKLDDALGGGLIPGTLTVVMGATGIGKTQLGVRYAHTGATQDGQTGVIFDLTTRGDSQNQSEYAQRMCVLKSYHLPLMNHRKDMSKLQIWYWKKQNDLLKQNKMLWFYWIQLPVWRELIILSFLIQERFYPEVLMQMHCINPKDFSVQQEILKKVVHLQS